MELKKRISYFSFGVLLTFVAYSCSSDEYDNIAERNKLDMNDGISQNGGVNSRISLIDSIGESDEFIDYIMSLQAFTKKFDAYYSALNDMEKHKFSSDLNNDDCIEHIIVEMDIKKEIDRIAITKKDLINNTLFLNLREAEKVVLFEKFSYIFSNNLIKTRGEGGDSSQCENAKKQAYDAAGRKLLSDQNDCDSWFDVWTTAHAACLLNATLSHKNALSKADDAYKRCMEQ